MPELTSLNLDQIISEMGQTSQRLVAIDSAEGAAGNLSVCIRWPIELRTRFPLMSEIELPQSVPELAGATVLVSGSGCRLREIVDEPTLSIGGIVVDEGRRAGVFPAEKKCQRLRRSIPFP